MKFAVILFSILIFINGVLLSFQFDVFSDKSKKEESAFTYDQEIDMVYRGNKLYIEQTFLNLPEHKVSINWMNKNKKKACAATTEENSSKENCERLNETFAEFKQGDETTQKISYTITVSKKGLKDQKIYKNMFATLKKGVVGHTQLHIVDENKRGGQWFTGLTAKSTKKMKLMDYYYFSDRGQIYEVMWQKKKYKPTFKNEQLTVYTDNAKTKAFEKTLANFQVKNVYHIDVVQGDKNEKATRILTMKSMTETQLKNNVAIMQISQNYKVDYNVPWLKDVVASVLVKQSIGSKKAENLLKTANEHMDEEQQQMFYKKIVALEDKTITTETLDKALSETLKLTTSFFSTNAENGQKLAPLLFEDSRLVKVNSKNVKNMTVILKGGQIFYEAKPLLKAYGYKQKLGEHGYYLTKKGQSYRFPMDNSFYVYNEQRYNITTQPIQKINGTYYIEESWLVRLFSVDLNKTDQAIEMTIES